MPVELDLRQVLETAAAAAREAGLLQKERLGSEHTLSYKGEVDLVTEVDRACEDLIVRRIREVFPDHSFLAEENQYPDGDPALRWIVDPLGGTTNYAHGFPWFCVSIAFERGGEILAGVVYHCMMDELFSAAKGEGAFLNGRRIKVSQRAPLRKSLIATGFPYDVARDNENNFDNFIELQLAARGVRRAGAAALDLACVAAGRLDGFWELKLKPWDVAAGTLLVQEAGGRVTNHAGEQYSVYDHRILASNGAIHDEMLQVLKRAGTR
ncbi:histidinol-phosphate phosphatase [Geoanaerobacter pelophilus]|uniref:Inositol-1-monophosphatase n=1 Tax=Geoanaerobacter pelophilus TaxID=60036 RepID=A0ABQ0MF64_9BACT|nr:inositol monophosphatase family protein [Geoanaerobacter pelophilus]GAW65717.1 histidinol-phosphate phosphatase [Geoanaerobacter pelophilus]